MKIQICLNQQLNFQRRYLEKRWTTQINDLGQLRSSHFMYSTSQMKVLRIRLKASNEKLRINYIGEDIEEKNHEGNLSL